LAGAAVGEKHVSEPRAAPARARDDFLKGGGELGEMLRSLDWASSSLGRPEDWPSSLKLSIRIMLTSLQPIWIGWGEDLIYFYNDPYKSIIGGKHPWALGRPTREVWREIWPEIGPMLGTALGGDRGTYVESQLLIMERNGYPEETYYTFSYSPIPDEDGGVGGIFCANSDDTQKVIGERQLALLRELAAGATSARTWRDVCESSAHALASDGRDLPFAMICLAEPGGEFSLVGASGLAPGGADCAAWPLRGVVQSGELLVVDDLDRIFSANIPRGPWDRPPSRAAVLPIPATGENARVGALVVGLNPYRLLDESYRGFLGLVAGQIGAAIASAQAYEEERRRSEALAELDRAKTVFFSNVSHEFRTPLTLMLSPIEDALNDSETPLHGRHRERIETAHRNSTRLLKLVNSLLDFSRIEAGRVEARFEPTDLAQLTSALAANFRSAIERADLVFDVRAQESSEPAYVDRDMWEKIVLNLVSNAFKFTFEGKIEVVLRETPDGRGFALVVSDTGVGIPRNEAPRLFERFHRIEGQRSRSFEGTGIGLALVHELVRIHGGEIGVESEEGRGARFTVTIPKGAAHLPQDKIGSGQARNPFGVYADRQVEEMLRWLPDFDTTDLAADAPQGGPRPADEPAAEHILIADDNADMRAHLQRLLRPYWGVKAVADGAAALQAIRERKPDLLLTDVMMPVLDGLGLVREIRADAGLRDLPVIMLSARAGEESRVQGFDTGADDYLTKPFSARELVARVNANLQMARVRRETTRDLRESEERFRNMADNAPVMMWVSGVDGAWSYFNRQFYEFTGLAPEQALGFGALDALHPEDREPMRSSYLASIASGETFRLENRLRRADGAFRWVLGMATPRFDGDGRIRGYIGSLIDITDRKEAERVVRRANEELEQAVSQAVAERIEIESQLRHSQKLEAVGRLTGGVAHDFNNVLQIIGGSLQLLARDIAGNPRAETRLHTALAGVSRGSRLASQLLAFGRRQPLAPKVVSLGRLMRSMDDLLRRALGEGVEVESVISGGLWNTFADPTQVENAVLNLAINSRDAMDGRGRLTVEIGNASLDEAYAAAHADVTAGQYVMLAVTDTGRGIPAELIEQVFEPFFTTKGEGQGTGLGLSMVYGFVKQSGGHVKIYSEPGVGTTVRMYLPRIRQDEDVETVVDGGPVVGGPETVLVVEDDEDVRATVSDTLSELGYRVLKARNATAALAIVESGAPIDLIFTDVVMPGPLRSPELARKARERLPNIAVLFTSGYTENAIVHGGKLDEGVDLLSKPYSREALARKLRQVIDARTQAVSATHVARSSPQATVVRRKLRILLVEDEPLIRMAAEDMLAELGHHVVGAADSTQALQAAAEGKFEAVIADLGLPGESGHVLAGRLLRADPSLALIFASGRSELPSDVDEAIAGRAVILAKPYDEANMRRALAEAVARVG
jgi:PAS domain S-box-containing protein